MHAAADYRISPQDLKRELLGGARGRHPLSQHGEPTELGAIFRISVRSRKSLVQRNALNTTTRTSVSSRSIPTTR
jgi:hypothetical protein